MSQKVHLFKQKILISLISTKHHLMKEYKNENFIMKHFPN